jgi:quercetin dioxygenase-like cupin family protein
MRYVLGTIVVVSVAIPLFGQSRPKPQAGPVVDSMHLFMQVEQVPATGDAAIFGDPTKPGLYVLRAKLAPNYMTRPHFNDQDQWVTVLKGTWWVGQGDVFKTDKLVPVREGGFMYKPANLHHYDVAGGNEVILQIVGNGPVQSTHTEVDEKGQPVPIGGPYPGEESGEGGRGYGRNRGRRGAPPPAAPNPQQPQQQQPQ